MDKEGTRGRRERERRARKSEGNNMQREGEWMKTKNRGKKYGGQVKRDEGERVKERKRGREEEKDKLVWVYKGQRERGKEKKC